MKALTILQPWAQLLVLGVTCFEVRRWHTKYRGPLLVHAGLSFSEAARQLCTGAPLRGVFARNGFTKPSDLPRGAFVGTVTVEDCLPTDELLYANPRLDISAFHDIKAGRWAWKLTNPRH